MIFNNDEIHVSVKVRLETEIRFFGPGTAELLELINQTGSLQKACEKMELSYSKGSRMVKSIEQATHVKAVERWIGGNGGGGSRLTEDGRKLLEFYRDVENRIRANAESILNRCYAEHYEECEEKADETN